MTEIASPVNPSFDSRTLFHHAVFFPFPSRKFPPCVSLPISPFGRAIPDCYRIYIVQRMRIGPPFPHQSVRVGFPRQSFPFPAVRPWGSLRPWQTQESFSSSALFSHRDTICVSFFVNFPSNVRKFASDLPSRSLSTGAWPDYSSCSCSIETWATSRDVQSSCHAVDGDAFFPFADGVDVPLLASFCFPLSSYPATIPESDEPLGKGKARTRHILLRSFLPMMSGEGIN